MLKQIKKILSYRVGPSVNYSKFNPLKFNWEKIKDFSKTGIIVFALVFLILLTVDIIQADFMGDDQEFADEIAGQVLDYLDDNYIFPDEESMSCDVAGIELRGDILTYIPNEDFDVDGNIIYDETSSERIVHEIKEANKDSFTKAIIIEVDSYGGSPAGAEEINEAVKNSEKPVIAFIREAGLSAAYLAISGADQIFALTSSDVGSIGVTMSYVDNVKKNEKEGLHFNQLSTGKFKDYLNSDKPLTFEEKQLVMRDINIINDNFISEVSKNRDIDINKVRKLADGSSMPGQMAVDNGLVDQIGTYYDAKNYVEELVGANVEVCW